LAGIHWDILQVFATERPAQTFFGAWQTKHPIDRRIDTFPQTVLEHVELLVDIRIYIAVHAEEPRVICARISHAAAWI
jgi:hypothetical protein